MLMRKNRQLVLRRLRRGLPLAAASPGSRLGRQPGLHAEIKGQLQISHKTERSY